MGTDWEFDPGLSLVNYYSSCSWAGADLVVGMMDYVALALRLLMHKCLTSYHSTFFFGKVPLAGDLTIDHRIGDL